MVLRNHRPMVLRNHRPNADSYPLSLRGLGPHLPISGSASDPSMIPKDKLAKVISIPVSFLTVSQAGRP